MNITFDTAYNLFNKEAKKRTPKHCTKDWQLIMLINCVEGLAGLSGYFITDSFDVKDRIKVAEKNNLLTLKFIFNRK